MCKSLQGLDYFAAEGEAFDDLMVVVDKVTDQERKGKENDEWYMK